MKIFINPGCSVATKKKKINKNRNKAVFNGIGPTEI